MIKLKQDILGIKAGSIGQSYGYVDNLMVSFESEDYYSYSIPYESHNWDEPMSDFTVHMSYVKENPELFEILEE